MQIKVEVFGIKEIIAENKKLMKESFWDNMMKEAMEGAEEFAEALCPVGKTKKLKKSIHVKKISSGVYEMIVDVPYASFHEFGYSGFYDKIGTVTKPKFYLGGYRPFIRPAMWEMNKKLNTKLQKIILAK